MSQDIQIRSGDFAPDVADPRGSTPEQMDSIFVRLHRLLRGRYVWALGLGALFAAGAAGKGLVGASSVIDVDGESKAEESKRTVLTNRRSDLVQQREDRRKEIEELANQSIGADDLRAIHQANVTTITKLQSAMT